MRWFALACFCGLILHEVNGQTDATVSVDYPGGSPPSSTTRATFTVDYFGGAQTLWIVDASNDRPADECILASSNTNLRNIVLVVEANMNPKKLTVKGVLTDCFLESSGTSTYTIRLLAKTNPPANSFDDNLLVLSASDDQGIRQLDNNVVFTTTSTPPPPPPVSSEDLTPVNYDPTLQITDSNGNVVTQLALGDSAKLRFRMTIPNFVRFVDSSGARVTNCIIGDNAAFNNRVRTLIDGNGCFTSNLKILNTTQGFTATDTPGTAPKNFLAETPEFAVFNLEILTPSGNVDLFFKCDIEYCDDDMATTVGTCGGAHCSAATRKKRDTDITQTVTTKVTIVGEKKCPEHCDMTDGYKATLGVIGGLVVILFFAMIFTYKSVLDSYTGRLGHIRSKTGSTTTSASSSTPSELCAGTIMKTPPSYVLQRGGGITQKSSTFT